MRIRNWRAIPSAVRWRLVLAVYRAEILSVLRDRWTVVVSVLIPVLLYPTAGVGLSSALIQTFGKLEAEVSNVCLSGAPDDVAAIAIAFGKENPPVTHVVECTGRIGKEMHARIDVPAGTAVKLAANGGVPVEVQYSSSAIQGTMAVDRVERALKHLAENIVMARLAKADLPDSFAKPLQSKIKRKDVAPPQQSELFTWAPAIIVFLVLFSVLGVFLPSIDLTAGDRERNTLETLMTSPASTGELIAGKFAVVFSIGLVSTALNVASLFTTLRMMSGMESALKIPVSASTALLVGLAAIPTVALSSAVCMAIGCLARSFRDAQNYMTPVYLAILLPAYAAALPTVKLTAFTAAVPMLNLPLILKEMLGDGADPRLVLLAATVDVLFCAVALMATARLYGHEGIAFSDAEPLDLLKRPSSATLRFTAGEALTLCGVATALAFYVGTPVTVRFGKAGVMLTLILAFFAPPFVYALWRRLEWRTAFGFRAPGWRAAAAAILLGASLWAPVQLFYIYVQQPVFPMPPEMIKAMRELLVSGSDAWPLMLLIGAVTPALCEEFLFRGAILQSLRPSLGRGAVVVSALLFALVHMSPWRLVPTFLLGLVLGAIVLRTGSIWTGILLHFVYNAVLLTLDTLVVPHGPDGAEMAMPVWLWIVPFVTVPIALWLLRTPSPPLRRAPLPAPGDGVT